MEKLQEQDFSEAGQDINNMISQLDQTITGQQALTRQLVVALFAQGHILLEGLPGMGKTQLVKALANYCGLDFSRIQCTPDLMPADITGSDMPVSADSADPQLVFQPGPVFSTLLLVDEINRASPKTQSALLEAMQEKHVTYRGKSHPLPSPFWLLATQNPIEIEGTYPLPEAQLDRFMVKLSVTYPDHDALFELLNLTLDQEPANRIEPQLSLTRLQQISALCQHIIVSDHIKQSAIRLILMTQPDGHAGNRHFKVGASPRALQALVRLARVHALMKGRLQVDIEDIAAQALPVLRHRVLLSIEAELSSLSIDELLQQIIADWQQVG